MSKLTRKELEQSLRVVRMQALNDRREARRLRHDLKKLDSKVKSILEHFALEPKGNHDWYSHITTPLGRKKQPCFICKLFGCSVDKD